MEFCNKNIKSRYSDKDNNVQTFYAGNWTLKEFIDEIIKEYRQIHNTKIGLPYLRFVKRDEDTFVVYDIVNEDEWECTNYTYIVSNYTEEFMNNFSDNYLRQKEEEIDNYQEELKRLFS